MLSEKHRRSSTVQEEGQTNESRHHSLFLHKLAHDKRGITESLHVYITRARLCPYSLHTLRTPGHVTYCSADVSLCSTCTLWSVSSLSTSCPHRARGSCWTFASLVTNLSVLSCSALWTWVSLLREEEELERGKGKGMGMGEGQGEGGG